MPPPTTAFLVPTSAELTIELATFQSCGSAPIGAAGDDRIRPQNQSRVVAQAARALPRILRAVASTSPMRGAARPVDASGVEVTSKAVSVTR